MHCTPGCGDSAYRVVHLSHLCSCFNADLKSLSASSYYYLSWSKLSVPLPREDSNNVLISFYFKLFCKREISDVCLSLLCTSRCCFWGLWATLTFSLYGWDWWSLKRQSRQRHICDSDYVAISSICLYLLIFAARCFASAAYAVMRCLSVCLCVSVTFIHSVKTN